MRAIVHMRLILVLASDLHPSEDGRVRRPGIVVQQEVSDNENHGNGDNNGPQLGYRLRRHSEVTQLFGDEPRFSYGESRSSGAPSGHVAA